MTNCPQCNGQHIVKNGHIHNGKQCFKCHDCGRQFVENLPNIVITDKTNQVSDKWLQDYVNTKYAKVPRQVEISSKKRQVNATSR